MTFTVLFLAAGLCFAYLLALPGDDDQVLRSRAQSDHFDVALYGPEGDVAVGPVAFSVLVQARDTHDVLLDGETDFDLQKTGSDAIPVRVRANTEDSENKLLQSAEVELPSAGDWSLNILVQHDMRQSAFPLPLHVVDSRAADSVRWPYLLLAGVAAILALTYLWRHRTAALRQLAQPVSSR